MLTGAKRRRYVHGRGPIVARYIVETRVGTMRQGRFRVRWRISSQAGFGVVTLIVLLDQVADFVEGLLVLRDALFEW